MQPGEPSGAVAEAYARMPATVRETALGLRAAVYAVADRLGQQAPEETLKWGEPAYLPGHAGTTLRVGCDDAGAICKLLVNCQTTLVHEWRERFEGRLKFEGNRAVLVEPGSPFDLGAVEDCISDALTYHARKKVPHG